MDKTYQVMTGIYILPVHVTIPMMGFFLQRLSLHLTRWLSNKY
jgi:hypothetical protein